MYLFVAPVLLDFPKNIFVYNMPGTTHKHNFDVLDVRILVSVWVLHTSDTLCSFQLLHFGDLSLSGYHNRICMLLVSFPESSPEFDRQTTDWTRRVRVPENVRQWMVHKGSVAVEGISLTIAAFDGEEITIAILPLTYWRTNLHTLAAGAPMNIEADVLVKLAQAQLQAQKKPESELTEAWLVANGY